MLFLNCVQLIMGGKMFKLRKEMPVFHCIKVYFPSYLASLPALHRGAVSGPVGLRGGWSEGGLRRDLVLFMVALLQLRPTPHQLLVPDAQPAAPHLRLPPLFL